jgi:hypothetical protein
MKTARTTEEQNRVTKMRKAWLSRNFMTPDVITYKYNKDITMCIELSTGTDFSNNNIYGVSISEYDAKIDKGVINHDLSKLFWNLDNAKKYIGEITDYFNYPEWKNLSYVDENPNTEFNPPQIVY